MEAHRTFREEVAGDGTPEEPTRLRAVLQGTEGAKAESAPRHWLGADSSPLKGDTKARRWVSEREREHILRALAPS